MNHGLLVYRILTEPLEKLTTSTLAGHARFSAASREDGERREREEAIGGDKRWKGCVLSKILRGGWNWKGIDCAQIADRGKIATADAHTSSSFTRLISRRDVRGCKICLGISLALNRFLGSKWRVVGGLISSRGLWFSVWLSIGCEVTTRNRWCNFRRSKLVSTYKMSVIFSSMHALMISFHFIEL